MNFVEVLPPEITEEILLYLSDVDMIHFSKVCASWKNFLNDDMMWKRFCIRKGLDDASKNKFTRETGEALWKNYYWTMNNFENMNFTTYTFRIDNDDNENNYNYVNRSVLNCMNLIIPSTNYLTVWDLTETPTISQILRNLTYKPIPSALTLHSEGNHFLQESYRIIQVFEKITNNSYRTKKILFFNMLRRPHYRTDTELFHEYDSREEAAHVVDYFMSTEDSLAIGFKDDILAVYQGEKIFIWEIETWTRRTTVSFKDEIKKIEIEFPWMYVMIRHDRHRYIIKIYDMNERKWLLEVLQYVSFGSMCCWNFNTGRIYMVSCLGTYGPHVFHMKIWKKNTDQVVSILEFSHVNQYDCVFDKENIIFPTSRTGISVWNPLIEENPLNDFSTVDRIFTPIKFIWGDVIVIQRTKTFDVLRWKTSRNFQKSLAHDICLNVDPKANGALIIHSIEKVFDEGFGNDYFSMDKYLGVAPRKLQVYNFSNRMF